MFSRFLSIMALAVLALSFSPAAVQADLTICNKTAGPTIIAIAFETSDSLISQGWWTILPNQCQIAVPTELNNPYYYYYAVSHEQKLEWRGNFNFCTSDDPQFRISGAQGCEQRSYRTTGFNQVDVGDAKNYTLNIIGVSAPDPAQAGRM